MTTPGGVDGGLRAAIGAAVRRFFEAQRPVGLIAGVLPRRVGDCGDYWSFAEGRGAGAAGTDPPDRRTVWQIGSITKTFTATLLAAAVRDLSIGLDDPAQAHAPPSLVLPTYDTWAGSRGFRLLDLATHTAGLPLDPRGIPPEGYARADLFAYLGGYALAVEPGTAWNYSNLGFGLLADLLVSINGSGGYDELVGALKALGRLDMPDTAVRLDPDQRRRRSQGYADPSTRARWRTPTWPALDGSGALHATLDDQVVWLAYNLGWLGSPIDDLLPITQRVHFESPAARMGLAWQHSPLPGGAGTYVGKSGNTEGFTSITGFLSDRSGGAVVLCNTASVWPQPLAEEILSLIQGGAT